MGEPVFVIDLECGNCGADWERSFPPQTVVHDADEGDNPAFPSAGVTVRDDTCRVFGGDCDCCYRVECPTCELADHVTVAGRNPVTDEGERAAADG